jgi:DNA-directed RNA polymerase specialized sigma24 family protein
MDTSNERIERLLVLLLLESMKGASQKEKVKQLNMAGFSNIEIAEFLQTKPTTVASLIYQQKKSSNSRKRRA